MELDERVVGNERVEEEGCVTPRHNDCQIPTALACPPAPKKKMALVKHRNQPSKNGFFQPPDLEVLFAMTPRREACA
ncbi:hypothetical protein I3760_01G286300 [Carya illinoinensis]|nr:hypothetical protein I3760_01G286300 [Carya illinoinensis]